jgi:sugar phosphate permease
VNAASGRAVMSWFGASERGLALGIRQAAIQIGGIAAALTLPALVAAWGLDAGFLALAAGCLLASALALSRIRDVEDDAATPARPARSVIRDARFLVLCSGSSLLVVAQIALAGFLVLFLHDERGFSAGAAAGVLALVQVIGGALRVAVGRWSDRVRTRIEPLRQLGFALTGSLALTAALTDAAAWLVVPALVVAGALSFAWNGLSFTAAAELAGRARSGAALGFQQTALAAAGAVTPLAFAAIVNAGSWQLAFAAIAAFPLAGSLLLGRIAALRAV